MKVLSVSRLICLLFLAIPLGSAGAVMVDFESPEYTAGAPFDGVDGWAHWGAYAGATVVTPDASGTGDTTVLAGAQSGRVSNGLGILYRYFDAGPDGFDTGSIVSGRLQLGGADGSAELFYSNAPASAGTPAGIIANVGGNFQLFGGAAGNYVDSGVPSSSGVSYFLEMELDLDAQTFTGYATPEGGARTLLGTTPFVGVIPKDAYPDSGFILVTRGSAIGVYDDLDVYVVDPDPPVPLLPEPVDFEADVYVAGESVVGVDGWSEAIWPADGMVTDATVLEGTKSLRLTGSPNAILQRNLGEGTVVDDGYIVSTVMMAEGPDDGNAEFHYSHNQDALSTPRRNRRKIGRQLLGLRPARRRSRLAGRNRDGRAVRIERRIPAGDGDEFYRADVQGVRDRSDQRRRTDIARRSRILVRRSDERPGRSDRRNERRLHRRHPRRRRGLLRRIRLRDPGTGLPGPFGARIAGSTDDSTAEIADSKPHDRRL